MLPTINQQGAREYLTANRWPTGLQDVAITNIARMPIRFVIVDDSGSMATNDGSRLIHQSTGESK